MVCVFGILGFVLFLIFFCVYFSVMFILRFKFVIEKLIVLLGYEDEDSDLYDEENFSLGGIIFGWLFEKMIVGKICCYICRCR